MIPSRVAITHSRSVARLCNTAATTMKSADPQSEIFGSADPRSDGKNDAASNNRPVPSESGSAASRKPPRTENPATRPDTSDAAPASVPMTITKIPMRGMSE